MKNKIFTLIALIAVAASCEKAKINNEDTLKDLPRTQLDVKYSVDNQEVKSLSYNSKAHDVLLSVQVNNENLKWKLESNRSWCVVCNEGVGSTDVLIQIQENESFTDRTKATLTFVAGDYRGFQISIDQTGSVFLLSQPFFIAGKGEQTFELNVTTPVGLEWEAADTDWLTATKSTVNSTEEFTTTKLLVKASENADRTRFGELLINATSGSYTPGSVYVSQFGSEYQYTSDGDIFLPADGTSEIRFTAPVKTIETIDVPKFTECFVTPDSEETETVTIKVADNLSDCQEDRDIPVEIRLGNSSATVLSFPSVKQDFVDAHGLMTCKGLERFARAVNEGGDISGWERDGVVTVLQDIDMADLEGVWTSIGTSAHPFSGNFNGGGFKIRNFEKSPAPLFGVCSNADISNLAIDETCSFYSDRTFDSSLDFAALAGELRSSTVRNCKVAAPVVLAGKNSIMGTVNLGKIAGKVDASSAVKACDVEGDLTMSSTLFTNTVVNVGGVAALCEGEVSACTSACSMELVSTASSFAAGSITAQLTPTTKAVNNTFLGTIESSNSSAQLSVGGLYGKVTGTRVMDFANDKSASMGSVSIKGISNVSMTGCFGSFIGSLDSEADLTFNGFESTTSIEVDLTSAPKAACINIGGFVGGTAIGAEARFSASSLVNKGALTNPCSKDVVQNVKALNMGGCVGLVSGNVSLSSCDNQGSIGLEQITAKSNGYVVILGGIIASAMNGTCKIDKCTNSGTLLNFPYNNNAWTGLTSSVSGGIIGAFNYISDVENETNARITECTCSGGQWGYRGICGGIVGYALAADIVRCSCTGNMNGKNGPGNLNTNNHAYVGGIAGIMGSGTVDGCTAVLNIYAGSPGSEAAQTGGIAGVITKGVAISGCSYYGDITKATSKPAEEAAGGIVGITTAATSVSSCKFGGSLEGQKVSDLNAANLACGDTNAAVSDIRYWDGN